MPIKTDCDIAIIGAGVAGLAAASELVAAGKRVVCLEAGDRIGGRILTRHDPLAPLPIELGAEFVHGRPPETWELIRRANLTAYEHTAKAVHILRGRIVADKDVGEFADRVVSQMGISSRKNDEAFEDYLRHSHQPPSVKKWARIHIEGFNAARKERISADSLTADAEAAEKIDGDRAFRILNGYDSIPFELLRQMPEHVVRLNSIVEHVQWRRGSVELQYRSALEKQTLRCRRVIVTVPLGVLQARPSSRGAIQFEPAPAQILKAASSLEFGHVYRVTFRCRTAFWEEQEKLKRTGFLVSQDPAFFAWWTTHPVISTLLTGWTAGTAAQQFQKASESQIIAAALKSLGRILKRKPPEPEAAYFRNWRSDPFFRGAYSYAPVDALTARRALSKPVQETLFFAGEATEFSGHASTVHGAIASGIRAAKQVLSKEPQGSGPRPLPSRDQSATKWRVGSGP